MSKLKSLEFQRKLKELQFVESDYLFQSEVLKQYESQFFESVQVILNDNPDLKSIWNDKIQSKKSSDLNSSTSQNTEDYSEILSTRAEIEPHIKKVYRDIVKSTHPDLIKNSKLNELYIEATVAYEENDVVNLIKVCNDLLIEIDLKDEILEKIEERITLRRHQIQFLESTFTSKWLKSTSEVEKNQIVLRFIENNIR